MRGFVVPQIRTTILHRSSRGKNAQSKLTRKWAHLCMGIFSAITEESGADDLERRFLPLYAIKRGQMAKYVQRRAYILQNWIRPNTDMQKRVNLYFGTFSTI